MERMTTMVAPLPGVKGACASTHRRNRPQVQVFWTIASVWTARRMHPKKWRRIVHAELRQTPTYRCIAVQLALINGHDARVRTPALQGDFAGCLQYGPLPRPSFVQASLVESSPDEDLPLGVVDGSDVG